MKCKDCVFNNKNNICSLSISALLAGAQIEDCVFYEEVKEKTTVGVQSFYELHIPEDATISTVFS